ncbi:hypothetical protein C2W62_10910 [Candidatus Entotheonella serta]|nr:hypothetical protein C2W62_10910 [Candidatus Entotheonella serta]
MGAWEGGAGRHAQAARACDQSPSTVSGEGVGEITLQCRLRDRSQCFGLGWIRGLIQARAEAALGCSRLDQAPKAGMAGGSKRAAKRRPKQEHFRGNREPVPQCLGCLYLAL